MTGVIAKPQMRGLLASWTKKNVSALLVGSTLIGVAYYFIVGERRKKAYAEFYKVRFKALRVICWGNRN